MCSNIEIPLLGIEVQQSIVDELDSQILALEGLQKIEALIKETEITTTKDGEGLTNLITKVPGLIVSLEELTDRIHKEAAEGSKIKGGRKKGIFEDASK
jgi:hypothetical protein